MSTQLINRTERLATIEKMLVGATTGLRVVEIAKACGVDRRTIYRDLALLNEFGMPIYQKEGRYFLNQEHYVSTVRLNLNEIMALYVASRMQAYVAEQQTPHIISALKKLSRTLPEPLAHHMKYMIDLMRSEPMDRAFVSVLDTLTRAWAEQRRVKLWYRRPGSLSVSVREFAVYFIEPGAYGSLYIIGYDYFAQQAGAVRLQWVKRIQMLSSSYEIPAHLERHRYIAGAWGIMRSGIEMPPVKVVLAFAPDAAPLVREKLRQTVHAFKMTSNNRCLVSIQVSDWQELLPWIRSWGAKVEVLEPQVLRDAVAAEALKLAAVYGGSGAAT